MGVSIAHVRAHVSFSKKRIPLRDWFLKNSPVSYDLRMALDLLLLSHNVSIGDSALTVPLPVNVQLSKGMEFLTMDSAVDHVTNYLFAHKIPHKMKESRPAFKMYVCSHKPDEASGAPKPKCAFKVGLNKRQGITVVLNFELIFRWACRCLLLC